MNHCVIFVPRDPLRTQVQIQGCTHGLGWHKDVRTLGGLNGQTMQSMAGGRKWKRERTPTG